MNERDGAQRDMIVGLLALQNGLIDQDQLVSAFRSWTRNRSRAIAELLVEQGALDAEERALLEGLAETHQKRHAGDAGRSLAALHAGRSTRESLGGLATRRSTRRLPRLARPPARPTPTDRWGRRRSRRAPPSVTACDTAS
jgi:hypothetical protein